MKLIIRLLPVIIILLQSCSSGKNGNTEISQKSEISFELYLGDNPQSTKADELGICATTEELMQYSANGELNANITIINSDSVQNTYSVALNYLSSNKFVTTPLILAAGTYKITLVTVSNKDDILFSAVNESSKYAQYVSSTLPVYFNIGSGANNSYQTIGLYEKGTINLDLLCITTESAEDFGFVKWNIYFTQVICFSFAVNMCDTYGEDFVGRGTIRIQNGTYNQSSGTFVPSDSAPMIDDTSEFPTSSGLGKLCFISFSTNSSSSDYYKVTMNVSSPQSKSYVGYISYDDMNDFKNATAWNQQFNFMHINFCGGDPWIFGD